MPIHVSVRESALRTALEGLRKVHLRLQQEHLALISERSAQEARIRDIDQALAGALAVACDGALEELRLRVDYAHQVGVADRNKAVIRAEIGRLERERIAPVAEELERVGVKMRALEKLIERRVAERKREAERRELAMMDEAGMRVWLRGRG